MSVSIVFVGEGITEYGRGPSELAFEKERIEHDGFLQTILKKAQKEQFNGERPFETKERIQWKNIPRHSGGKNKRNCPAGDKLAAAVAKAQFLEADAIIFIVDDHYEDFTDLLLKDLADLRKECSDIAITAGTAIRMIEAALLADKDAVTAAFNGLKISRSKDPEKVADPKKEFLKAYETYQESSKDSCVKKTPWQEARRRIFEHLSLKVLKKRCPKGLSRFIKELDDVLKLFED